MQLKATAKINLALDVIRKREDGYHEVRMIMQMVDMYDRIRLTARKGQSGIRMTTNLPYIPTDEGNLAYRAAKLLMDEKGVTDGLDIRLDKFIPVAAGLAGGSSDAAAAMKGVNRLFRLGFSDRELMERGARIGADVPYCILKGTALSEGIGEILTPLKDMPDCFILLSKPAINVSTKEVYTNLRADSLPFHPDVDAMRDAIERGDLHAMTDPALMANVLETVTSARYPVIEDIKAAMMENGALQAIMSGSGPTVFGIFDVRQKAEAAKETLKKAWPSARTFLTWPSKGEIV
jgi:4-diphosphocytidyl-2-C-methyl-D-erythritol kinase